MYYEPTWEEIDEQMDEAEAWEAIEAYPKFFERGPKPESMDKQTPIPPFKTVLLGDLQIVVVGADGAYDALQRAFTFPKHPDVVVLIDGQIFVVKDCETAPEAVEEAVKASKSKRKRTIKKKPEPEAHEPEKAPSKKW